MKVELAKALPFALFVVILPFPGTVGLRLLLLLLCFGTAVWQWWRIPSVRAAIPGMASIGVWVAVCAGSLFYSVDPAYSAGELKNELGYTMMALFAFYVVARDVALVVLVFRAAAIGLLFIGGWALLAWLHNGLFWDESGRYGGTGVFSTYLVTLVPMLTWMALADPRQRIRSIACGLVVFCLALALISLQRVVWPAFAVQGLILLFLLRDRLFPAIGNRRYWVAALLVVAIAAGALYGSQQLRFGGHSADAEHTTLSADVRFDFWPTVVAKVLEHPITGAGFGRQAMRKAYPEMVPENFTQLWHAHNTVLNYGLSAGLPGMAAILALFFGLGRVFWQRARENASLAAVTGLMLIAGVFVRNQFNDFFVRDMSLMFWAYVGIFIRLATHEPDQGGG